MAEQGPVPDHVEYVVPSGLVREAGGNTVTVRVSGAMPLDYIQPIGIGVRLHHDAGEAYGYVELVVGPATVCRWMLDAAELDRLRAGWGELNVGVADLLASLWAPNLCLRCRTIPAPKGPAAVVCAACGASLATVD